MRACYYKANTEQELSKLIEKMIITKLKPMYEKQIIKGVNVSDEDVIICEKERQPQTQDKRRGFPIRNRPAV